MPCTQALCRTVSHWSALYRTDRNASGSFIGWFGLSPEWQGSGQMRFPTVDTKCPSGEQDLTSVYCPVIEATQLKSKSLLVRSHPGLDRWAGHWIGAIQ